MTEKEIVAHLIATYPDAIVPIPVYNSGVGVDFVETVDNFSMYIMRDFDKNRQKYYFGVQFESPEECSKHLAGYLHDLMEACQDFVDDTFMLDGDGEIAYIGEEE